MSVSANAQKYLTKKKAGAHKIVASYAPIVETDAKRGANPAYWKSRSGHATQALHAGWEPINLDKSKLFLAHGVKYGRFLEEGTAPHIIRPKNKKALFWGGAAHPVQQVKHPGTKARPLLEDTLKNRMPHMRNDILEWYGATGGIGKTIISGPK